VRQNQRNLKDDLKEQQRAHQDFVKTMKMLQAQAESTMRADFERLASEIEEKYVDKLRVQREEMDLRRRTELHEVEERKNKQLKDLIKNHEKEFANMKDYYNDVTTNNLAMVNTLKETMEDMKKEQERIVAQANKVMIENRRMKGPLERASNDLDVYRRRLQHHDHMRGLFDNTKGVLKRTEGELKEAMFENEVILQQLHRAQKERDALYDQFLGAIHEIHQKSSFKNLIIEKKTNALLTTLEMRDAEISELITQTQLEPHTMGVMFRKLETVLESKNDLITDLQYEVARVSKAHNDMLGAFETRFNKFGIPPDDCGFYPLELGTGVYERRQLGIAPAGLVSKPV